MDICLKGRYGTNLNLLIPTLGSYSNGLPDVQELLDEFQSFLKVSSCTASPVQKHVISFTHNLAHSRISKYYQAMDPPYSPYYS